MRRGVGAGAAIGRKKQQAAFQKTGAAMTEANLEFMQSQMDRFKTKLEEFALKHKKQINKDPEFRNKFQTMCAKIGVDPLASNKGFWSEVLGVGKFYYELGVQIVHVCLATRDSNGGIMQLGDLVEYLQKIRSRGGHGDQEQVNEEDVKRAIGTLEPLGNGMRLVQVGPKKMLVSVPMELSSDHTSILNLAQDAGGVIDMEMVQTKLHWGEDRSQQAIHALQNQGMIWVDRYNNKESFWFPSMKMNLM